MTGNATARVADAVVARLAALPTSTLANALDAVGLPDNVLAGLVPVALGPRLAGPAMPVLARSGPTGTYTSADFRVGAIIDAAAPGDVVVIAGGGAPYSTWGGMASLAATVKGIAGLVADCGVRDREEIAAHEFPVFARHVVPTTGRSRLRFETIGEAAVTCAGVRVAPGDAIVGDGTGVVCVPAERAEEVAALAERYAREDAAAEDAIRAGVSFSEAMRRFGNI